MCSASSSSSNYYWFDHARFSQPTGPSQTSIHVAIIPYISIASRKQPHNQSTNNRNLPVSPLKKTWTKLATALYLGLPVTFLVQYCCICFHMTKFFIIKDRYRSHRLHICTFARVSLQQMSFYFVKFNP